MKPHTEKLFALRACWEAGEFADQFVSLQAAWDACPRGDWLLWLIGKTCGLVGSDERRKLVGVCAEIAREVLPIFANRFPDDDRMQKCIELCERYANGDWSVSLENLRDASDAAYDAAAAA